MTTLLGVPASTRSAEADLVDGRYRLLARLGRGATAQVWSATDERLGRVVAVKLFHADAADHRRRSAELEVMARLSHPGLVSLFDAGSYIDHDGRERTYLVLEFVPGGTLRDRLAAGGLPAGRVAAVGSAIAAALHAVHERGMVHRDVKPANILLPSWENAVPAAKLADFGVTRLVDVPGHTEVGTTVGTASYLSPEQLRGEPAGPPSDVHSLGLVLLEALTGRRAYPTTGALSIADLDRAPEIPQWLGREWVETIDACTRRDPAERPSAAHAARRLDALVPVPAWR